jgi:uncharacterized protein YuzE
MKIAYDPEVDALNIRFRETTVTTKHLAEGIAADYDRDGKLAGIEILDVRKPCVRLLSKALDRANPCNFEVLR